VDQIVYASTPYTELKSTLNQQASRLIDFGSPAGGPRDERLRAALRHLVPHEVPGVDLVRVGGRHDGGYVMADDFDVVGAVSVGVGPDVSWDSDIGGRGIPVAMFDPTVRRLPARVPNGRFFRIGVSGSGSTDSSYRPLDDLVDMAGFHATGDLLLKIDVEGAEWAALSSAADRAMARYRQVVVEMHHLSRLADENRAADVLAALTRLARTHVPLHLHANNYSRLLRFDHDWFPDAVEASFVRRDLASGAHPASRVRTELDYPSDPRVEEIDLSGVLSLAPA
jgi:hypothetical protein